MYALLPEQRTRQAGASLRFERVTTHLSLCGSTPHGRRGRRYGAPGPGMPRRARTL